MNARAWRVLLVAAALLLLGLALFMFSEPYHQWRASVLAAAAAFCLLIAWKGVSATRR